MESKTSSLHNRSSEKEMRVMGILWAICATLPILETFLFNVRVNADRQFLGLDAYLRIGLFSVLLLCVMCFAFLIEKNHVEKLWSEVKKSVKSIRRRRREFLLSVASVLVLLIIIYVFSGGQAAAVFLEGHFQEAVYDTLLGVLVVIFIWFLAWMLHSAGESLPGNLKSGVESWALSLRASTLFYVLLLAGTLFLTTFQGINADMRFWSKLSTIKDYVLLFMISNLLYAGVFKLARASTLAGVFGEKRGVLHFMIICAIIAVLAVWADFRTLDPLSLERMFPSPWQRHAMVVHVFVRDIFLLLFPISWLLFWTVKRVSKETPSNKGKAS